jgi:glycine/D-amino acid oxidase-like deaminating enzyme
MDAFARWLDLAKPHGVDTRLLSGRETEALLPNAARWVGALHTPSDAMAEPFVTVPVLARAAAEAGVIIREGCAVRGLETSAGRLSAVVTEAGTVRCAQAILAGGAWSALFLRAHGIALPQLSVLSSISATSALPEFFQGAACDDRFAIRRRADGGYTLTPWSFHEFFIGPDAFRNLRVFLPQIRADLSSTHFRTSAPKGYPDAWGTPRRWSTSEETPFERCRILNPQPNAAELARLQSHFAAAFPSIGAPTVAATWAGMIDVMPDALPVVDHTPLPGLILATGMSGHGFGIAPGIGKVTADLALGRTPSQDLAAFRFGRFNEAKGIAKSSAL